MWLTGMGSPLSGSGIRQVSGMLVMQVEDLCQRVRGAAELGMVDDVGHALAVDPDLARAAQAFQKLLTRPCRQDRLPFSGSDFTPPRHGLRKRRAITRLNYKRDDLAFILRGEALILRA